ncbi:SDR family oxidoreductase [Streptomyces halobius]|uniref:SDR family oxidoreductase n=1 Tax=Streptomyces halobius TaxID=2879846 RepID=A0ABY4M272_9ACTN|nr:SDR family oxidoreductase [Streptomyces halobius]UQA91288.1 SDR family oxidoreductase [Streptomyces halobius]
MTNNPTTDTADVFAMEPPERRLLDRRKALVTGADSGIGQAIAYRLAAHGAAVAINHVGDSTVAEAMVRKIESAGGKAITLPMDVTQEEQVRRAFARTAGAFHGLDLLVNNAGIERPFRLVDMELEWWQKVIDVNLTGTFLCSREAARIMLERGSRGAIVNITSVHETIPWAEYSHYCASKGGQRMFAQSIARELAPHGIRVLSVAPGAIETPINKDVLADPQRRKTVEDEIPLGRWGKVSDVAGVVAFLASERADYIVGSTVFVDGGMTLYPRFV